MVEIIKDLCVKCMSCVGVCPFNVIKEYQDGVGFDSSKHCIECLHCGAICPEKAIEWLGEPAVLEEPIFRSSEEFSRDFRKFLLSRRSIRLFENTPIPRELLEEALQVAAYAPSAKNQHPSRWIVMDKATIINACMKDILEYVGEKHVSEEIEKVFLEGRNVVFGNAPTVLIGCSREDALNPSVDLALEAHTAALYLESKGIGSCWAGYFARFANQIDSIKNRIKLEPGERVYLSLMMGYSKDETYLHIPIRKQKQPIKWLE